MIFKFKQYSPDAPEGGGAENPTDQPTEQTAQTTESEFDFNKVQKELSKRDFHVVAKSVMERDMQKARQEGQIGSYVTLKNKLREGGLDIPENARIEEWLPSYVESLGAKAQKTTKAESGELPLEVQDQLKKLQADAERYKSEAEKTKQEYQSQFEAMRMASIETQIAKSLDLKALGYDGGLAEMLESGIKQNFLSTYKVDFAEDNSPRLKKDGEIQYNESAEPLTIAQAIEGLIKDKGLERKSDPKAGSPSGGKGTPNAANQEQLYDALNEQAQKQGLMPGTMQHIQFLADGGHIGAKKQLESLQQ